MYVIYRSRKLGTRRAKLRSPSCTGASEWQQPVKKSLYVTENLTIQLRRLIQQKEKKKRGVKWRWGGKYTEFVLFLSVAPLARLSGDAQEKEKEKKKNKREMGSHLSEEFPPRGATRRLYTWRLSFCSLPLARARTHAPVLCARVVRVNFERRSSRPNRSEVLRSFRLLEAFHSQFDLVFFFIPLLRIQSLIVASFLLRRLPRCRCL